MPLSLRSSATGTIALPSLLAPSLIRSIPPKSSALCLLRTSCRALPIDVSESLGSDVGEESFMAPPKLYVTILDFSPNLFNRFIFSFLSACSAILNRDDGD